MFNFVTNYLAKRNGKKEYEEALVRCLSDGKLEDTEKQELEELAAKLGLSKEDVADMQRAQTSFAYKNMTSDGKISEEEKASLESLLDYFGFSPGDIQFDQKTFNKFYALGLIEKGILPTPTVADLNIELKKGEVLHWACPAITLKRKTVTRSMGYSGLTGSVRIMKGVHYRMGSIKLSPQRSEHLVPEDSGALWITNQRLGVHGDRKSFSLPFEKIHSLEATADGIVIFKEGKETPYIIKPVDLDVPLAVIDHLLNA